MPQTYYGLTLYCVPSRYIRLVGTLNTVNRIFHVVHFECMFSSRQHSIGDNNVLSMLIIIIFNKYKTNISEKQI
jgi:hypothetical protein